jgi:hypothetical protein
MQKPLPNVREGHTHKRSLLFEITCIADLQPALKPALHYYEFSSLFGGILLLGGGKQKPGLAGLLLL